MASSFGVLSRLPDSDGLSMAAQQALQSKIVQIQTSGQQASSAAQSTILTGGHANRLGAPASKSSSNTLYFETDRNYLYIAQGNIWQFVSGVMSGALAARPSDLVARDAGACFAAFSGSNYTLYIWSGSAWLTRT